jgi:hypothetical protein
LPDLLLICDFSWGDKLVPMKPGERRTPALNALRTSGLPELVEELAMNKVRKSVVDFKADELREAWESLPSLTY